MARAQNLSGVLRAHRKGGGHATSHGLPADNKPKRDNRQGARAAAAQASRQATRASSKASTPSDHEATARLHSNAAQLHMQAGQPTKAQHHSLQASKHLTYASKLTTATNASNARAGSFGTDPATGNPQSKAKVYKSVGELRAAKEGLHKPLGDGSGGLSSHAEHQGPKGGIDHTVEARHYRAHEAARSRAQIATNHANAVNTSEAHTAAARAHGKAMVAARAVGNHHAEDSHQHAVRLHNVKAQSLYEQHHTSASLDRSSGYMAGHHPATPPVLLGQPPKGRGLGRVNAKGERVSGHRANVTGIPGAKGNMNDAGRVGARDPVRKRLNAAMAKLPPTYDVKAAQAAAGPAAKPYAHGYSTGAHVASLKANAKPSLASHSLAAKAHMQAAAAHYEGSPQQHEHLQKAAEHRALASQHSQRIMKLKKLGPGQHHGAGGRFTGTPGGAK